MCDQLCHSIFQHTSLDCVKVYVLPFICRNQSRGHFNVITYLRSLVTSTFLCKNHKLHLPPLVCPQNLGGDRLEISRDRLT